MSGEYVVIVECANGNASIGSMWFETGVFEQHDTLKEVMEWAKKKNGGEGKIILTVAD